MAFFDIVFCLAVASAVAICYFTEHLLRWCRFGVFAFGLCYFFLYVPTRSILDFYAFKRSCQRLRRCRDVVNFTYAGDSKPGLEERLRLRAGPNQRLVTAFGIENSFTTGDGRVHRVFMTEARKSISNISGDKWKHLFEKAEVVLGRRINEANETAGPFFLAPCVRLLCFSIVSAVLFDIDPAGVDTADADTLTREINRQWLESKKGDDIAESQLLVQKLNRVLGASPSPRPAREALGRLIPAYETLWRVVLLTFAHVSHIQQDSSLLAMLDAVPDHLAEASKEEEALKVAKEGLRLYPSTKRVYRADASDLNAEGTSGKAISADVEACQRDPLIWGPDALDFRPSRFDRLTEVQATAYFPFGLKPHVCPASPTTTGFGERLITMLVAVLERHAGAQKAELHLGGGTELKVGVAGLGLPTGRDDMEHWTLSLLAN